MRLVIRVKEPECGCGVWVVVVVVIVVVVLPTSVLVSHATVQSFLMLDLCMCPFTLSKGSLKYSLWIPLC
jgi:hypothetical protein